MPTLPELNISLRENEQRHQWSLHAAAMKDLVFVQRNTPRGVSGKGRCHPIKTRVSEAYNTPKPPGDRHDAQPIKAPVGVLDHSRMNVL